MSDLTDKQELFVLYYLQDPNATKAAKKAGYSEDTAYSQGQRLLKNAEIKAAIEERLSDVEVTTSRILIELSKIAYADMEDFGSVEEGGSFQAKSFDQLEPGASRAIKKIKEKRKLLSSGEGEGDNVILDSQYEFELHDKLKAIELLGKYLGMFDKKDSDLADQLIEIILKKQNGNA